MTNYSIPQYIISYELYCQRKRCNVWYAFVCAEKDIDKRLKKVRQLAGFVITGKIKVGGN